MCNQDQNRDSAQRLWQAGLSQEISNHLFFSKLLPLRQNGKQQTAAYLSPLD
jgi:hypothetical protein